MHNYCPVYKCIYKRFFYDFLSQLEKEKVQALERELDGARSDFKDLNTQLDKAESQISSLKEAEAKLGQQLKQEGEEKRKEIDRMEAEIGNLKTELNKSKEETAQVSQSQD